MHPLKQILSVFCGIAISAAALAAGEPVGVNIPAQPAGENEPADTPAPELSPSGQYAVAYESLTQADWLKTQGMHEEACELYSEAKNIFQQLTTTHPSWETKVVAFRIKYCANELARLRLATPITALAASSPAAPRAPAAAALLPTRPESVHHRPDSERDYGGQAAPASSSMLLRPADIARLTERMCTALQKERAADLKGDLENYLTVLEEQPRNPEAIKGASRCCLRAGLPDDARGLLERGMSLPDPDPELNLLMALVFCRDKEFNKAYQLLIIVLDAQPVNAVAHLAMGVTLAGLDKLNKARVETQKSIQLDPKLGDAYYNLARISLKLKPSSPGVARGYYISAIRYGSAPDPDLAKQIP